MAIHSFGKINERKETPEKRFAGNFATEKTRPDTRHEMRLVSVLFTFENNTGHTDIPTDLRTDGHDLF